MESQLERQGDLLKHSPKLRNGNRFRAKVWLSLALNEVDPAELIISGQIGKDWWDSSGISGKEFRDAINQVPKGQKNQSPNQQRRWRASKTDLEIYNAIKERSEDVTSHISRGMQFQSQKCAFRSLPQG